MVTGIEVAGLALAVLPLILNQIDAYALGIEKIKGMRRYRREFKGYSVGLSAQHAILLNTLEQALEGIVDDEDQISELISDPQGVGWKDPDLQKRLRRKLDRNYEVFIDNMAGLSEMLERLSHKLDIGADMKAPVADAWNVWKFRKIMNKAVYTDLLSKIDGANTVLKTLVDQSSRRESIKKRRPAWTYLLKHYKKARKQADDLFQAIIGGDYWRCQCKGQHCIHLQLQTNPFDKIEDCADCEFNGNSKFRLIFSNTNGAASKPLWTWAEVEFEPWRVEETLTDSSVSGYDESKSLRMTRPKVQFRVPSVCKPRYLENGLGTLSARRIQDICSSLSLTQSHIERQTSIGLISNKLNASVQYTMHAVKILPSHIPQRPLYEALAHISRRDRLHIAASLACGVVQFCGNWLKFGWDSSDIHLADSSDSANAVLYNLYLSRPLLVAPAVEQSRNTTGFTDSEESRLLPLGLALVELSLGKSLDTLLDLQGESRNNILAKFQMTPWLIKRVYLESGINYAQAVNSCLSWSAPCLEEGFVDRVFDNIVSPLLKDLENFEGLA